LRQAGGARVEEKQGGRKELIFLPLPKSASPAYPNRIGSDATRGF